MTEATNHSALCLQALQRCGEAHPALPEDRLLASLYELLSHPDGDVRRTAGEIMGEVLANSGPKYRKERPNGAHESAMTPTIS